MILYDNRPFVWLRMGQYRFICIELRSIRRESSVVLLQNLKATDSFEIWGIKVTVYTNL